MIRQYRELIDQSLKERRSSCSLPVYLIATVVVAMTLLYILLVVFLVPSDAGREYHFVNENGAATALSAILLACSCAFSLCVATSLRIRQKASMWAWIILSLGFCFLSFDELLQFHERLGRLVERVASSGVFRSWNDVIVIFYGVIALLILAIILPGLLRARYVLECFAIGFIFYLIHTVVDSISEPPSSISIIIEESAKLLCGSFLAIGSYVGLLGTLSDRNTEAGYDHS